SFTSLKREVGHFLRLFCRFYKLVYPILSFLLFGVVIGNK
ncbi:hypothetical protein LINPERHAP2_LOCUS31401, partial [Linum perenne]